MAEAQSKSSPSVESHLFHAKESHNSDNQLGKTLQKFWALESVPPRKLFSPEEQCEQYFISHYKSFKPRYIVSLLFSDEP